MTEPYDVLINGGGPVGMGLAIDLGQRGMTTCVVERHPEPQPIPKGQNLTQRTCEHFRAWGCEDEIRAAHSIPEGAGIGGMTCYGTLLTDYHYDWLNRAHVAEFYAAANARLPQYATERVLRARAAEIPEVTLLYGWSGTALETRDDGALLTVSATSSGETRTLSGRYVVGCDGNRSLIREATGISETRSDHDRLMVLLVFRSEELHDLLKRYPGKAFYNVLHPDYEGYWQFFGRVDHGVSWFFHAPVPLGTTKHNYDFRALLHRAVGQPVDLSFDYIGFWDLRVSMANRYRAGPAFIAGDAAHSHPPYGGYGINTGFEDARNLGWKIAADLSGWAGPALLDSYDAERRPVFASTASDFIERFIEEDRDFLSRFSPERDRDAFETAWYSRNLDADEVNAFEPNYEGSPIVTGSGVPSARGAHSHVARAGHHLSPQKLTDGSRSSDALDVGFTLLCDTQKTALAFEAAAAKLGVPLTAVPELTNEAVRAYRSRAVLIRPDAFVAWSGDGSEDPAPILSRATGHGG